VAPVAKWAQAPKTRPGETHIGRAATRRHDASQSERSLPDPMGRPPRDAELPTCCVVLAAQDSLTASRWSSRVCDDDLEEDAEPSESGKGHAHADPDLH
jgi:hypothetical protein